MDTTGRRAEYLDRAHALVGAVVRPTSPSRAPALTTRPPTSDAESGSGVAAQPFRGAAPGRSSVRGSGSEAPRMKIALDTVVLRPGRHPSVSDGVMLHGVVDYVHEV